jgi:hypothetical protein
MASRNGCGGADVMGGGAAAGFVSVRARLGGGFRVDAGLLVAVIRRWRCGRMLCGWKGANSCLDQIVDCWHQRYGSVETTKTKQKHWESLPQRRTLQNGILMIVGDGCWPVMEVNLGSCVKSRGEV